MSDERDADGDETREPRSARVVAERCLALVAAISHAHGAPGAKMLSWLVECGVESVSVAEKAFLLEARPENQAVVDFSWKAEGLAALFWALGGLPSLWPLNQQVSLEECEVFRLAREEPATFLARATLRPLAELKAAEEDLFDQHWRVRDAQLFGKPMPPELHPGIVYERRYALTWLVGWGED